MIIKINHKLFAIDLLHGKQAEKMAIKQRGICARGGNALSSFACLCLAGSPQTNEFIITS